MRKIWMLLTLAVAATVGQAQKWDGESAVLPKAGGLVNVKGGTITFSVPANAVGANTTIYVLPNDIVPSSTYLIPGTAIAISRPGVTFAASITLSIKYDPQALPVGVTETALKIYKLTGHRWTLLGGTVDTVNDFVRVAITTTGTYAVFGTSAAIPAENLITFVKEQYGDPIIYRVDPAGDNTETLGQIDRSRIEFNLFQSENSLVTARFQPGTTAEFYISNIDGSNLKRVTSLGISDSKGYITSADGKTLYLSTLIGATWKVYRVFADGTGVTFLTNGSSTGGPAINRAGTALAFADNGVIKTVNPSTGALIATITTSLNSIRDLAYNPAGTLLAFAAKSGASDYAIYTVPVTGGAPTKRSSGHGDRSPAWSPDGTMIAFNRRSQVNLVNPAIRVMASTASNSDGTMVYDLGPAGTDIGMVWR